MWFILISTVALALYSSDQKEPAKKSGSRAPCPHCGSISCKDRYGQAEHRYGQAEQESEPLDSLSSSLRELSKIKNTPFETIKKLDAQAEDAIRTSIRMAPAQIVKAISGAALQSAMAAKDMTIAQEISSIDTSAPSAASAADAASAIAAIVRKSPVVHRLTNSAIRELERLGVLGGKTFSDLVSFLGATAGGIAAGGMLIQKFQKGGQLQIGVGNFSIAVDRLGNFAASVRVPIPRATLSLAVQAAQKQMQAKLQATIPVPVRRGSATLSPYLTVASKKGGGSSVGIKATAKFGGDEGGRFGGDEGGS
jgi:hypothetical protein